MIERAWIFLLILFGVLGFSGMANADLIVIGTATYNGESYNLIYEDDQDLIWMDYTNTRNRWPQQMAWASGLNAPGVLTYNFNPGISVSWKGDWRLPKAVDGGHLNSYDGTTTAGFNNTTSEMGHLYYKSLGNLGYYDTKGNARAGWGRLTYDKVEWGLKKTGPFSNLVPMAYWTSTTYEAFPQHAWDFNWYFGSQNDNAFKSSYSYCGLAVRPATVDGR